jgi:hypothetical protein
VIVAIVGSRGYRPRLLAERIIDRLELQHPDNLTIVSGGETTGVDGLIEHLCHLRGYHFCMSDPDSLSHLESPWHMVVLLPADATPRAKFARNTKVVQHVEQVIALFADGPRSPGTSDTVAKALKAGLPVHVHHEGRWSQA